MAMHTSYRYEVMKPSQRLLQGIQRQKERIKNDEAQATLTAQLNNNKVIEYNSQWTEELDMRASVAHAKKSMKQVKAECGNCKKASLMVRRAALQQLLEYEYREYEKELHAMGLAVYFQRE